MDAVLEKFDQSFLKKDPPNVRVGYTVRALIKIKEGTRERTQVFSGVVVAIKGKSVAQNVKIRKISYGIGVEKTIPLHSPVLQDMEIVSRGKPRRAKLFYLRKRVGKMAVYVRPLKSDEKKFGKAAVKKKAATAAAGNKKKADDAASAAKAPAEKKPSAEVSAD